MQRLSVILYCLAWLWLNTASVSAATITSTNPKIVPTTSVTLPATSTTSALPPKIASISSTSCIKTTDKIALKGSQFGIQSSRGVAVTGYGLHVDMTILKWSDSTVVVQLPVNSKLVPGKIYAISIESNAHQILSNSMQGVQLCTSLAVIPSIQAQGMTSTLIPTPSSTFAPAPTAPTGTTTTTIPTSPTNILAPDTATATAANPSMPTSMPVTNVGTLSERPLPQPPTLPNSESQVNDQSDEPDEIVVVNVSMQEAEAFRQNLSGTGMRVIRRTRLDSLGLVLTVVQVPKTTSVQAALVQLRQQFPALWLDTNARYQLQGNSDASARYHYAQTLIKWPQHIACGSHAKLGLIDSIIDTRHPYLQGQRIQQQSFLSSGVAPAPANHGTAIASLLVGKQVTTPFSGLIPDAQLLASNVFRQRDADNVDTTAELLVRALDWLVGQQVSVINISLGGKRNLLLEAAITRVLSGNIAVVAAAGNGGPNAAPVYPAAQTGVIAVTAVDAAQNIYASTNQGDYITVAAPGVDVWSATPGGNGKFYSGTSYAAPFVSAYVALQQHHDTASLTKLIQHDAKDLGSKGHDAVFGWGLLQAQHVCEK